MSNKPKMKVTKKNKGNQTKNTNDPTDVPKQEEEAITAMEKWEDAMSGRGARSGN